MMKLEDMLLCLALGTSFTTACESASKNESPYEPFCVGEFRFDGAAAGEGQSGEGIYQASIWENGKTAKRTEGAFLGKMSPDGTKEAKAKMSGGEYYIKVFTAEGEQIQNILLESVQIYCQEPSWSPDSKKLIVGCDYHLYLIMINEEWNGSSTIIADTQSPAFTQWSANGKIFYSSSGGMYTINPDGTGNEKLPLPTADMRSFDLSPKETKIAFIVGREDVAEGYNCDLADMLYMANIDGTDARECFDLKAIGLCYAFDMAWIK